MNIEYGSEVFDKNGTRLGKVDYMVRDTWTGEIRKFMIYGQTPEGDLAISPEDVKEITDSGIKLDVSSDALNKNVKQQ